MKESIQNRAKLRLQQTLDSTNDQSNVIVKNSIESVKYMNILKQYTP